jgi:hypothetical protein
MVGAAFAWAASSELARSEALTLYARPLAVVGAFVGLVWLPALTYFVAFHGDWSYLYFVPWRRVPSAIDVGLLVLASATVPAGFWLGAAMLRKRRLGYGLVGLAAPALLGLGTVPLVARRLGVSATYAQFHGDFGTESLSSSLLGKGVLCMDTFIVLGIGWTVWWLARMVGENTR